MKHGLKQSRESSRVETWETMEMKELDCFFLLSIDLIYYCLSVLSYSRGQWPIEYQVFLKKLRLLHCVPLYVCRLCINFQDLCASLHGDTSLRILFSPSFHAL